MLILTLKKKQELKESMQLAILILFLLPASIKMSISVLFWKYYELICRNFYNCTLLAR